MAITFLQKKKRPKHLNLILVLAVVVILLIIWQGFSNSEPPMVSYQAPLVHQQISINWQLLQSVEVTELQAFEETVAFEGEVGRDNPFIPY